MIQQAIFAGWPGASCQLAAWRPDSARQPRGQVELPWPRHQAVEGGRQAVGGGEGRLHGRAQGFAIMATKSFIGACSGDGRHRPVQPRGEGRGWTQGLELLLPGIVNTRPTTYMSDI